MKLENFRSSMIALTLALGFCAGASAAPGKLVLTGSSTVSPLAAEIGKQFEARRQGVQVDVQSGGSSRGVGDARSGLADIGMVSRDLKPEERDLRKFTIALDGVCIIVNKANPIKTLSDEQVVAIYTGKIRNWKEVGGRDEEITVVNKAEGRSTLELFTTYFGLTNRQIKADVVIGDNAQGIKTVAGNKKAIGYVSIGTAEFEHNQGVPIYLLPLKGVAPSIENVRNRSFPLMRELNLVTKGDATGLAMQFIEYARSSAVSALVKEQYFVPLDH